MLRSVLSSVVMAGLALAARAEGVLEGWVPLPGAVAIAAPPGGYGEGAPEDIAPPEAPRSVVWVGGGHAAVDAGAVEPHVVRQEGFQFSPAVSVVRTGTAVRFPNADPLYHSVFSYSAAKRFDLGRYRRGEEPPLVVMDLPGVVLLFCEIHEHMRGAVVAVDTPWSAVTDERGWFRIGGLPAGEHVVRWWAGGRALPERLVEVRDGEVTQVDWRDERR